MSKEGLEALPALDLRNDGAGQMISKRLMKGLTPLKMIVSWFSVRMMAAHS